MMNVKIKAKINQGLKTGSYTTKVKSVLNDPNVNMIVKI